MALDARERARANEANRGIVRAMKYMLEIYEPGSARDIQAHFDATGPFLSINRGDLINLRSTDQGPTRGSLRVVGLEHIVWGSGDDARHKLCVFTELVEDNERARGVPD